MDDIKLALLGDKETARRLTDAGVLLPCPMCKGDEILVRSVSGAFDSGKISTKKYTQCRSCFLQTTFYNTEKETRLAWNTRAPILSAEEMEMLEGNDK
jgi:hypothetical protein